MAGMLDSLAPSFLFVNRSEAEFLGICDGAGIDSTVIGCRLRRLPGCATGTGAGDAFAAGFLTTFLR